MLKKTMPIPATPKNITIIAHNLPSSVSGCTSENPTKKG